MPFRVDTNYLEYFKTKKSLHLKSYPVGPNNWGIFLILLVTTGEGIRPAGEISPVVCMLKNGLPYRLSLLHLRLQASIFVWSCASLFRIICLQNLSIPPIHRMAELLMSDRNSRSLITAACVMSVVGG